MKLIPSYKSAYELTLGESFRFIDSKNPLDIRTGTVVGYSTDAVLADYPLLSGVMARGARIHINTILPKQLPPVNAK